MVLNCVAYGCNNLHDARKQIPFHTFPFKRPKILELWVAAISREDWYPTKTSRLCGKHFLPSDYQVGCNAKILKPDAVPTIFSFSKRASKKVSPNRILVEQDVLDDEAIEEPVYVVFRPVESELKNNLPPQPQIFIDKGTQTVIDGQVFRLKRQIKTLKQTLRRKNLEISNTKYLIKEMLTQNKKEHSHIVY